MVEIKSRYSPRERVQKAFPAEGRTKQSFKDECDINHVLARYRKTGVLPMVPTNGTYLDVAEVTDYHSAMNFCVQAQQLFELLPAPVRKRFENDPGEFLAFAEDPANRAEMIEMGLVKETPEDVAAKRAALDPAPETPPEPAAEPAAAPPA